MTIILVFAAAVIGHGVMMWYRLGKIEGKIEMLCLQIKKNEVKDGT